MFKENKKAYAAYAIIILLQVLVIIFWANKKTNYFIDEFYSMGYARGFTGNEPTAQYITLSPEWTYNEWHSNFEFKNQLYMTDDAKIWNSPIKNSLGKLITGRNYFGLLNLTESITGFNSVSNFPAVVLNIILFVVTEIGLLFLLTKLSVNLFPKLLALSMFGFSAYFISVAEYVRFYMLVVTLFIMMLNLFYVLWRAKDIKRITAYEIGIFVLAYLILKNSELIGPYFAFISFCLLIGFAVFKKWKQFISYSLGCMAGVAYIWLFTGYLQTILNPTGKAGLVGDIVSSINEDTIEFMKTYREWELELISDTLFGHTRIALITIAALTGYTLWMKRRIFKDAESTNNIKISVSDITALIIWIIIYRISVYRNNGILISKGILTLVLIWLIVNTLWKKIKVKGIELNSDSAFVIMLMLASVLYTVFTSLPNLRIWRYYCFVMVVIPISLWYLIDRLLKKTTWQELTRGWYIIFALSAIVTSITPFVRKNIYYTYEEDKQFESNVRRHDDLGVVLLCRPDNGQYDQYVYDCINIRPDDSEIYLINLSDYKYEEENFRKEFILWDHQREDTQPVLEDLSNNGYTIESLDRNHISQAYVCRKESVKGR